MCYWNSRIKNSVGFRFSHHVFTIQQDHVTDEVERYGVPACKEDQATLAYATDV